MSNTPKSKGELPFSDELLDSFNSWRLTRSRIEPAPEAKPTSKTETALFAFGWLIVLVGSVLAIAGTAGYVYTRWLA